MALRLPHFANTLLFRISATFLLLLGISLGGYWYWIENEVFNPYADEEEQYWYESQSEGELRELRDEIAAAGESSDQVAARLVDYGARISDFEAEVILFGPDGRNLVSTAPDSLGAAVPSIDAELIAAMSREDWDFDKYPVASDIDAYENRIFDVARLESPAGETTGFLALSFFPMEIISDDLNTDSAMLRAQDTIFKVLFGLLIYSAVTALLIMIWTGRRVQRLSAGVETFAAGDLSHRVRTRSSDEIGTLGRNFNAMAERIETMVEKLRQKEQFQRQLIANMSHDLRTPMASMRGYVETLQISPDRLDDERRERYLKIIAGNLDHLDRLVEHMLVLSRFDSGQATFRMEAFPVAELADGVQQLCIGLAREKGIRLEVETEGEVELVRGDPLQLAQVLQNLVENGLKFNAPGGQVVIRLVREEDRVRIEVQDDGDGISGTDLPRIFDRFYTGDESRTRQLPAPDAPRQARHLAQSTGLGLAIASKIVAGHGSSLSVASREGKGSLFSFTLPAVAAEDQDAASG